MRVLLWAFRLFLFFTLFAFALNNQHLATVHWFFGAQWSAPMVILVLAAFALGCMIGVLVMVPGWWRHRREAQRLRPLAPGTPGTSVATDGAVGPASAARDGL